jgi:diguanylate cyclase (GGDEF)-like protein/PAS domain S-box-containing protein
MVDRKALQFQLLLAGVTGILFLLAAIIRDHVAYQSNGFAAIWPRNALVLGVLIARGRTWRDIVAIAGGGLIANILFHVGRGDPAATTALFSFANLIEGLVALVVLRRLSGPRVTFNRVSDVLALMLAAALAALPAAFVANIALAMLSPTGFTPGFGQWYASGVLSQLVVAPMVVILAQLRDWPLLRATRMRMIAELILVLGLVAVATSAIFAWTALPLLFLVTPMVLFATFRLRALGAAGAVMIIAVISGYATVLGYGPIVAAVPEQTGQSFLLQLFLASCFLTALPVAAMLTERDVRDEAARQLAERFKAVVENIGEVIFRIDCDGRWAYLNPAWAHVSGYPIADCMGDDWLECVEEPDRTELADRLQAVLRGEARDARHVMRFRTAVGVRWMEIYFQGLRDQDGVALGATGTLRDIDDRKRREEHVMTAKRRAEQRALEATLLASTDELTGIANRRAFMRQLDREIRGAAEFGWPLAVAIFDVDHFKEVNDRHGHAIGDKVLQLLVARAGAAIRGGDLIGRLGGEEFGILMPGATAEDAGLVAERLRRAIEMSRTGDQGLPRITVSIGIALRANRRDASVLLAAADSALYAAKGAGRNQVRLAA